MKYRQGSVAAAIKRLANSIEAELEAGKSRASIRRQLMDANSIGGVSQAHFNLVLADLGIGRQAAQSADVRTPRDLQPVLDDTKQRDPGNAKVLTNAEKFVAQAKAAGVTGGKGSLFEAVRLSAIERASSKNSGL